VTDNPRCALHGVRNCLLCAPASQFNVAMGADGHPLPISSDEVKAKALQAVDDGDLLCAVFKLPSGDLSFQVFGPPSRELVELLKGAMAQYERAVNLTIGPADES